MESMSSRRCVTFLSFVRWWNISVRHGAKPLLLMKEHMLSHIPATSSGRSPAGFSGMEAPADVEKIRHSNASKSRASDI